jgi:hypothetical protein
MSLAHASLGASNAHRWLQCSGSVKAEQGFENKSSPFAYEGTCAHELSELALLHDKEPSDWIGKPLVENSEWIVDEDMAQHVTTYTDYVRSVAKGADDVAIEQRVSYSDWVEGGFGTADAVILKGDTIHVCDLKYGKGVQVGAENNPQGMLYALGAYAEFGFVSDFKTVSISIIQPRLDHISEWSISVKDLLKWAEWVSQRAELALSEDAERTPGEKQCRFCKAKATCPALFKYTEDIIMADFEDLDDLPSPDKLSDDNLRRVLEAKGLIEGWLTSVEEVVYERLEAGKDFKGFKLVAGRSLRRWDNEEEAEKALSELIGDMAYVKKMVSPAQAEKLVKKTDKAKLQDLIVKPAGKATLAPESDKRPPINLTDGDFEDVTDK